MKIILYTPANNIENEVDLISQLMDNGVDYLYIYKPDLDDFSLVDYVETIPERYWKQCISTSLIITKEFDLGGYHFKRDIVQKNELYNEKILNWLKETNKISSVTAHSIDELKKYKNIFNHVIVSPLFPSISKENHSYDWNMEELKLTTPVCRTGRHDSRLTTKLFAVGGVDIDKIEKVKNLNFDGIGLLGAIWSKPNEATVNFKKILHFVQNDK